MKTDIVQNGFSGSEWTDKIAKACRIVTAPPVMALWLILITATYNHTVFLSSADEWIAIAGLVIIPALAYPVQGLFHDDPAERRKKERKLAFILNLVGYFSFYLYCIITHSNCSMLLVASTYLFAVIVLSIVNKCTPYHASGHACCVCAPLALIVRLVSWRWIGLSLALGAMMVWSSLHLRRHTAKELLLGALSFTAAYCLALIVT